MDALATGIFTIFLTYGYLAVFAGVMLDNAGFPLPGELILLVTGSLVAGGHMDFGFAVAAAATGALLSDFLWYLAGRRGSRRIIQIYCRFSFGSVACMTKPRTTCRASVRVRLSTHALSPAIELLLPPWRECLVYPNGNSCFSTDLAHYCGRP